MRSHPLEPGLLPIFRIYLFLRIGAMILIATVFLGGFGVPFKVEFIPTAALFTIEMVFLIFYLYSTWMRRRLGAVYLPIALLAATVGPILEMRYVFSVAPIDYIGEFWLIFPFLAVPLILTAWQYSFREVMLFCVFTAFLDLSLVLLSHPGSGSFHTYFSGGSVFTRTLFFMVIGYIVSTLMDAQRRQRAELAEANRKLIRYSATLEQLTITRERNRLARELHDTLAHTLSGLAVELDALTAVWQPEIPAAKRILEHALTTTREGLDETRRALRDLRASPLNDLGFGLALRNLASTVAERGALQLNMDIPDDLPTFAPEVEQAYYRVAQEALDNVIRHAEARTVTVKLALTGSQLRLTVADDGRGLSMNDEDAQTKFGIQGMEERAALIGGTLMLETSPETGTTVVLLSNNVKLVT
ncbi:MAG: sensor histidine kinase [Anaerolineales bacterium]|nr:MAG: sensor histidine kinase [Anaerolineales bacterium]